MHIIIRLVLLTLIVGMMAACTSETPPQADGPRNEVTAPAEARRAAAPAPRPQPAAKTAERKSKPKPVADALPESLSMGAVRAGMNTVRESVYACSRHKTGTSTAMVYIKVKVLPSGAVASAEVEKKSVADFEQCITAAVKKAVFSRSQKGASFKYPFIFR